MTREVNLKLAAASRETPESPALCAPRDPAPGWPGTAVYLTAGWVGTTIQAIR
jgi:hypothetical protein